MNINLFGPMCSGKTTLQHELLGLLTLAGYSVVDEWAWLPLVEQLKWKLDPVAGDKSNAYRRVGRFVPICIKGIVETNDIDKLIINAWIPVMEGSDTVNVYLKIARPECIEKERRQPKRKEKHLNEMMKRIDEAIAECKSKKLWYIVLENEADVVKFLDVIRNWEECPLS